MPFLCPRRQILVSADHSKSIGPLIPITGQSWAKITHLDPFSELSRARSKIPRAFFVKSSLCLNFQPGFLLLGHLRSKNQRSSSLLTRLRPQYPRAPSSP